MLDAVGPLAQLKSEDVIELARSNISSARTGRAAAKAPETREREKPRTLWVKLPSQSDPAFRRIGLILTMFPGTEPIVLYLADTKKRLGGSCVIHPALVDELTEMLGRENVIVK